MVSLNFSDRRPVLYSMQTEKFHDIVSNKHGLNIVHWAIELKLNFSMELPKGPYPPGLCMADRALLAGYLRIIDSHWNLEGDMSNLVVSTVPAEDLAPTGARASADTVMTKVRSRMYTIINKICMKEQSMNF